jgi:hypothetical protein
MRQLPLPPPPLLLEVRSCPMLRVQLSVLELAVWWALVYLVPFSAVVTKRKPELLSRRSQQTSHQIASSTWIHSTNVLINLTILRIASGCTMNFCNADTNTGCEKRDRESERDRDRDRENVRRKNVRVKYIYIYIYTHSLAYLTNEHAHTNQVNTLIYAMVLPRG